MPKATLGILTAVVLALAGFASTAADAPADGAISAILEGFVKPGEPGCTVGVTENGALSHALAFGLSDIERAKPLDTHSTFDLASVSKQFTAFALLLLQQQGKLSLDDPLVKHMPELAASAKGVTLRHLVHHTGGLRDYIALITMRGRTTADGSTINESVEALARQTRPNAEPGVEYEYSNTGYLLLGVVIARVSGKSLAEFSEEQIFRPLGMVNTRILDRYPDPKPRARAYVNSGKKFVVDETGWEQVGDGGVQSDLHDLALWDENFYTARLGGRSVIDEMYKVGVLRSGEPIDYAAGLSVGMLRGIRSVRHGGSWVGYRSHLLRLPDEHVSVIVLCNRDDADTGKLANQVAEVFLKDKLGPPTGDEEDEEPAQAGTAAPRWQPGDLARYAGAYASAEALAQCRIYLRDGKLVVEGCAQGAVLKPGKAGEFTDEDESFTLRFPENGSGNGSLIYDTFGLRSLPFTRVTESTQ